MEKEYRNFTEMTFYRYCLCANERLTDRERNLLAGRYVDFGELFADSSMDWKRLVSKQKVSVMEEWVHTLGGGGGELSRLRENAYLQEQRGIFFAHAGEEHFPQRLLHIPDPPLGLFYKGKIPEEKLTISVIGARDCTLYGQAVAEKLGTALGECKIPLVSGMARGIDAIAQRAAVVAGGSSYAVLGCGVDICYPASSRTLYESLPEKGGILSTYCPGTSPRSILFPPRNRIVSGLSDIVVVVEAGEKSGTLITVDMALEQGKEVYVVPGRISDRLSFGCNRLISQGAEILWNIPQFVSELTGKDYGMRQNGDTAPAGEEGVVYRVLEDVPKSVSEIETLLGKRYDTGELLVLLMRLVLEGKALQPATGFFARKNS